MKCSVCNTDLSGNVATVTSEPDVVGTPHGLTITTNQIRTGDPGPPCGFMAIFGFWDQRTQSRFDICGACLVERLMPQPTIKENR